MRFVFIKIFSCDQFSLSIKYLPEFGTTRQVLRRSPITIQTTNYKTMPKKALLIGIDEYTHCEHLPLCVVETKKLQRFLGRNEDNSVNFECRRHENVPSKEELENHINDLFSGEGDTALFYFSGHGMRDAQHESYLVPATAEDYTDCLSLTQLLRIVNASKFRNRVVILDSCFSGAMGIPNPALAGSGTIAINNGVTILTSSRAYEPATMTSKGSTFTNLLLEALNGSAADVRGNITTGSIYAYIDQALGAWEQRPLYKTNVSAFNVIRKVTPAIPDSILRRLVTYFKDELDPFLLDPSFEWTNAEDITHKLIPPFANAKNVETFKELQKLSYNGLVVPVGASCMYDAAMESKSCKLTELGKQYWRQAQHGRF